MKLAKLFSKQIISISAISGALLVGLPILALAQGNPGLVIFSGEDRKNILDYKLDLGFPEARDRYYLYIPAKKLPQGASKFYLSYPKNFSGSFKDVQPKIRLNDDTSSDGVPVEPMIWDKEGRFIVITPKNPIDPNTKVTIVLPKVKNPNFGTYYMVADVQASGDIPVRLYVGTWILSFNR